MINKINLTDYFTNCGVECKFSDDDEFVYLTILKNPTDFDWKWLQLCTNKVQEVHPTSKLIKDDEEKLVFQLGTLFDLLQDPVNQVDDTFIEDMLAIGIAAEIRSEIDNEIIQKILTTKGLNDFI